MDFGRHNFFQQGRVEHVIVRLVRITLTIETEKAAAEKSRSLENRTMHSTMIGT